MGRLDGLIAAAGINHETPALDYPQEEVDRMMSINVTGAFMTAQAAARQMVRLKQPGSIAMVASMRALSPTRACMLPHTTPRKLPSFSSPATWPRNGDNGIRVNTLSPGYILTAM